MPTEMLAPPMPQSYDRDDPDERRFAALVRDAHDTELLGRVDRALNLQLDAFFAATGGLC
jgi:hypothetical protein